MKSNFIRGFLIVAGVGGGIVLLGAGATACGDSGDASNPPLAFAEAGAVPYNGPVKGGLIPRGDGGELTDPPATGPVTEGPCCMVTLSLADATQNEVSGRLVGDLASFTASGLSLSYAAAAWSASVCLPPNSVYRYQYRFTLSPDADAGADAGASIETRVDPAVPSETDLENEVWNVGIAPDCLDGGM